MCEGHATQQLSSKVMRIHVSRESLHGYEATTGTTASIQAHTYLPHDILNYIYTYTYVHVDINECDNDTTC